MALIKQFGLSGVNENVQFGKGNGRLKFDTSTNTFSIRNLADSDLVNIHVKDPILNSHAVTKEYVDSVSQGLRPKASVRVATNKLTSIDDNISSGTITNDMTNLSYNAGNDTWTLAGGIIDNITLATNDRVLIKDAAGNDAVGNGIWVFNNGTLTRASDADNLNPAGQNVGVTFADIIKSGSTSSWEIGAPTLTWPTSSTTSYGPDTTFDSGYGTGHCVVAKEMSGDGTVFMIGQGGPNSSDPNTTFHLYKFDNSGNRIKIGSIDTGATVHGRDSLNTPSQHADFTKTSGGEYKVVVGSLNNGFQVYDVNTNTMDYEVVSEMGNNADDVACDGDYVVANNSYDTTIPGGTVNGVMGYARVFNIADGTHLYDIVPPNYDGFGTGSKLGYRAGVKVSGNWLVIGTSEWGQNSVGRIDVWNVTTGAHLRTIQSSAAQYAVPPGADYTDFSYVGDFGQQFHIDGDNLAVTMHGEPSAGNNGSGGMIEIYDLNTGNRLARLQNPNGNQGNSSVGYHHDMGRWAVDISGDYVATDGGDWQQGGTAGSNKFVTYLFNWRDGTSQEIYQPGGNEYDQFGKKIALSGGKLWIGAPYDDFGGANASNPGRVYQYNATSQAGSPETIIVNNTTMDIQGTPQQCADTINNTFNIPRLVASVNGSGQLTLTYSPNASDDNLVINASAASTTGLPSGTFAPVSNTSGTDIAYSSELSGGAFTFVLEGRTWADTGWVVSSPAGVADIGTDPITWVQFSRVTGVYADDGLAKDGNRIFVRTDGQTIHIDNDDVAVKSSNTQYQSLISDGAGGTANWEAISLNESGATQNLLRRDRGGLNADVSSYADQSLYVSNGFSTEEFSIGQAGQLLTVDNNGNLAWGYGLSGVSNTRQVELTAITGSISIGTAIPANSRVTSVTVKIDQAYDSGVSMIVGDGTNADSLATADEIDPQTTGLYKIDLINLYSSSTQLSVSISGTTANGSGYVIVDYVAS